MKTPTFKITLFLFLFVSVSLLSEAQVPNKIVKTFYGTKTRKNFKNPCKGATLHKCGTIEITSELIERDTIQNIGYYLKKEVIYDSLDIPIAEKTKNFTGTLHSQSLPKEKALIDEPLSVDLPQASSQKD